jgi:UDP-2,3-diacylglucosamine hydrolase
VAVCRRRLASRAMSRPDFVASDIHLGAVPRSTERAFIAFLEHVGREGAGLLLNGDLFDFWFEYGDVVPGRHFRTLAALAALVDGGVPVTLVGGNHDAWGGRFLTEEVGVRYHVDPFHMTLGGRRALVAHGDGLGRGDFKYRALKAVIRSRAAIGAFRVLHPQIGTPLMFSSTEKKAVNDASATLRARFLDEWAAAALASDPMLELVLCGHSHQPVLREHAPGRFYINSGDWVSHFSYVTIAPGSPPVLHRWRAGAAGGA